MANNEGKEEIESEMRIVIELSAKLTLVLKLSILQKNFHQHKIIATTFQETVH